MRKILSLMLVFSLVISLCACGVNSEKSTVKIDKGSSSLIAHRGLSGLERENSKAAFVAAGERSYYGIEADVRRTSDGQFVICHDADLKRLSGEKIDVEGSTLDLLKTIDIKGKNRGDSTSHLLSLEEYILICKKYEKMSILELKSLFTKEEVERIVEIISSIEYIDRVTFISFDYANLSYVRNLLPEQSVQLLCNEIGEETIKRLILDRVDLSINHKSLTKEIISTFHSAGLKVGCWTVNNKNKAEKYVKWGVDYITTDILE